MVCLSYIFFVNKQLLVNIICVNTAVLCKSLKSFVSAVTDVGLTPWLGASVCVPLDVSVYLISVSTSCLSTSDVSVYLMCVSTSDVSVYLWCLSLPLMSDYLRCLSTSRLSLPLMCLPAHICLYVTSVSTSGVSVYLTSVSTSDVSVCHICLYLWCLST